MYNSPHPIVPHLSCLHQTKALLYQLPEKIKGKVEFQAKYPVKNISSVSVCFYYLNFFPLTLSPFTLRCYAAVPRLVMSILTSLFYDYQYLLFDIFLFDTLHTDPTYTYCTNIYVYIIEPTSTSHPPK